MKISEQLFFICLKVAALWNWLWIPPTCLIYFLNKDISPWFEYGFHSHMNTYEIMGWTLYVPAPQICLGSYLGRIWTHEQ